MTGIDVKQIMKEIEKKVEEKKKKGEYTEDLDAIALEVLKGTEMPDEVEYYLQKVNVSWFLDDQTVTTIHKGLKGKFILLEKKLIKAIVRPWLCAVIDTQRDFNSLVVKVLNAFSRKLDTLSVRLETLVNGLEQRVENISKDIGISGKDVFWNTQNPILEQNTDRFSHYLKYFDRKSDVIDIACKDASFLRFLKENGIEGYGLVPDERLLKELSELGVDVRKDNLLDHLFDLPSDISGGIFASGIVEFMTLSELRRFIASSYDVLEPGSWLVIEIANPRSVMVLRDFWKNRIRFRPVYPETLVSLMKEFGFTDIETNPILPFKDEEMLGYVEVDEAWGKVLNENFKRLNDVLFGNRFYVIAGRK